MQIWWSCGSSFSSLFPAAKSRLKMLTIHKIPPAYEFSVQVITGAVTGVLLNCQGEETHPPWFWMEGEASVRQPLKQEVAHALEYVEGPHTGKLYFRKHRLSNLPVLCLLVSGTSLWLVIKVILQPSSHQWIFFFKHSTATSVFTCINFHMFGFF